MSARLTASGGPRRMLTERRTRPHIGRKIGSWGAGPSWATLALRSMLRTFREAHRSSRATKSCHVLHLPRGRPLERRPSSRRVRGGDRGYRCVVRVPRRAGGTCANPQAGDPAASRGSVSNRPKAGRYTDDIICHCKSAEEARALWSAIADRSGLRETLKAISISAAANLRHSSATTLYQYRRFSPSETSLPFLEMSLKAFHLCFSGSFLSRMS